MRSAENGDFPISLSAWLLSRQLSWRCLAADACPIDPAWVAGLPAVDRPCLEAFRTLFEKHSFADGWTSESVGGLWDRQGRRYIVFDVDATRQPAASSSAPLRSCVACCSPPPRCRLCARLHGAQAWWGGAHTYHGAPDAHPKIWSVPMQVAAMATIVTNSPRQAILSPPIWSTLLSRQKWHGSRLDGQYGDAAVIVQLMLAGVYLVTRGRGYQRIASILRSRLCWRDRPTARVTAMNTGEVVELFEGGWLEPCRGLPHARVIVARRPAPPPDKPVRVGKRVGEWVYELFITTLDADGLTSRGCSGSLSWTWSLWGGARWWRCRRRSRSLVFVHWVRARTLANRVPMGVEPAPLAWPCDARRRATRAPSWAPPKERPPLCTISEGTPEAYGPWQWAGDAGRARGRDLCHRLHVAREWHPAMSSGVEPVAQRTASRKCLYPTSRLRWLAGRLSAMSAAWAVSGARSPRQPCSSGQRRPPPVARAFSRRASNRRPSSDTLGGCGGTVSSPHLGCPTFVDNTSRWLLWLRPPRAFLLPLPRLGPSVLIVASVGTTGSRAMPGGDHHNCASPWLAFPLFWLVANERGISKQRGFSIRCSIPLNGSGGRRSFVHLQQAGCVVRGSFTHHLDHIACSALDLVEVPPQSQNPLMPRRIIQSHFAWEGHLVAHRVGRSLPNPSLQNKKATSHKVAF